jgi:Ca2+/Na+ antiporter
MAINIEKKWRPMPMTWCQITLTSQRQHIDTGYKIAFCFLLFTFFFLFFNVSFKNKITQHIKRYKIFKITFIYIYIYHLTTIYKDPKTSPKQSHPTQKHPLVSRIHVLLLVAAKEWWLRVEYKGRWMAIKLTSKFPSKKSSQVNFYVQVFKRYPY